jgi:hypothetical protein
MVEFMKGLGEGNVRFQRYGCGSVPGATP